MKRTKNSRYMHMIFNVQSGTVEVRVHENEFVVHKQGVWQVPRGMLFFPFSHHVFRSFVMGIDGSVGRFTIAILTLMHARCNSFPWIHHIPYFPCLVFVRQPSHYARRDPGICMSPIPQHNFRCALQCHTTWGPGQKPNEEPGQAARLPIGEANPILVTCMFVALAAACCVTFDAYAYAKVGR